MLKSPKSAAPARERVAAALALAKLFAASGDEAFREGARRELAAAGREFPRLPAPACRSALAGVAAIEAHRLIGESPDPVLVDATIAAALVESDPVDTLCCGSFGRVEALLLLAELLGRAELGDEATRRAGEILDRTGGDHVRFLAGTPRSLWSPSFLHGDAGVGYTLLRLSSPDVFPSLLLWR